MPHQQLAYERAEGDQILVVGQSGDSTTATFRRIGPGASVTGTLLFRVRDGLPAGATITITPEYFCGDRQCLDNLAQVQLSSAAVRGEDGTALAGVLVAAFDADGTAQAVGRSGADGGYTLLGLAAGSYRVGYFAEYAGDGAVRRYRDGFSNGKASLAEADAVAVAAGQTIGGIDAALASGGSIAGRVTTDEGGAGLPGVVVIAFDGAGGIAAATLTGTDGGYELPGLTPGPHTVLFDTIFAPGEASRGYIDEAFDNRREPPFTSVAVTAGATAVANAGLARGGQIAGRVTAADSGLGLAGVAVLVFSGDALVSFAMSDASGAYTTAGLPAGSYTLRFDPSRSADQEAELYAPLTRDGAITVAVGLVTAGIDAALARR